MAVLCEAISLIIRAEPLTRAFGGFENFKAIVPNQTLVTDNEIIRVGFMVHEDVDCFVEQLEARGLRYIVKGKARDMVVVDQISGPHAQCDWIEFGRVSIDGGRVVAARLTGSMSRQLATPDWWKFEGSFSQTYIIVPRGAKDRSMRFLREENGVEVYLNLLDGEEVYIGRTGGTNLSSKLARPDHRSRETGDATVQKMSLRQRLLALAGRLKR